MIKQCFNNHFQSYLIDKLIPSRTLPVNIKSSGKYKQIVSSIAEIGLIEPVIIFINDNEEQKVLDGHLRIEALKDLNIAHAHCLISPVEDTYSYNKRVNHLTILQEQKMLQKAVESGVPVEKLCAVLGLSQSIINTRLRISDGIAKEVLALLAEKNVSQNVFDILRRIKPYKQIEFVTTMITLNNFTKKFALSMLHTLPSEHLVRQIDNTTEDKDMVKTLARLEKEMAALQIETQNIQNEYAENNLNLIIVKSYIAKLLRTNDVIHWLYDNKCEYLDVLKKIVGIESLSKIEK
ncbi:RepB plasmid partitioning protein [Serratia marcescens]|uniref:RepB plasmid partitioning protein n=1 Tax=Serratia marcescens TaxID=615 RepID=A0A1Q4NUI7_SERMA|nr:MULTISPECIES: plasmid partitioning protein RepB C-terminal domain-containing protein [Serratia]MBH3069843.1 ParB N-terminal domain-containing protein [Serratia marcescens]MCP1105960.1 ParB N-terminal domain-containing protein [Serratia nevei]OKB64570.1 RepB plasmid partitioning protein [Serratia marcescens]HEJ0329064.1 ParB N-terminal domain-containing protein [Serratia marcescens]